MKRPAATQLAFFALLLRSAIAPIAVAAQQAAADPFIWLEDIDSKRSMDWVNAHNTSTVAVLGTTPLYQSIYDRTKAILDSKAAQTLLPVTKRGILGNLILPCTNGLTKVDKCDKRKKNVAGSKRSRRVSRRLLEMARTRH